ncbi:helix-turn-helix domain-containing protein [Neotabrizicola shimadae]|uniref:Helix-turn-helix domain-containing protein n=1 Tax=Neotabrizicola shimadae TaxID=2807096 RepID=A0A8G0ZU78_9RHOB|nr:helix-turn-helix domain-containing protein [Neotabrizicola shimadae]QYZ69530.1 helix-turn-helix domain-containing protein [Neotabrizicola shimadae]
MPTQKNPKLRHAKVTLGEELLTIKEIAALDRCSERTVRRAIDAGLLKAIRVGPGGRLLRITRAAHQAYRMGLSG